MSKVTTTTTNNGLVTTYALDNYSVSIFHIDNVYSARAFISHDEYTDEIGSGSDLYDSKVIALAHLAADAHRELKYWEFEHLAELLETLY